ncbi:protein of unknown function [Quadrisphaera granulorum]|uniref:Uncharacterized protein DUF4407 n=1 Tax=Quadrisphaera granulorum TaxID=317664 RepID=A0A315ZS17_9ACTN|nr:DUF4407 domain-containing protein [Quadrisphaera granulorum]PWJ47494.1 uncharacterized protein DUF4407 [Quadrisphaera granulorum]SZE98795.1 protein of unknown function [Quadrisphaera granulorum]
MSRLLRAATPGAVTTRVRGAIRRAHRAAGTTTSRAKGLATVQWRRLRALAADPETRSGVLRLFFILRQAARLLWAALCAALLWLPRTIQRVLLWAAGTDHTVLTTVTTKERATQEAMGATLFASALLAGCSSLLGFQILTGGSTTLSVVLALGWAVLIFTMDRFFVLSTGRSGRWLANVGAALPRLFLAVLIGAVVSTPLTLQLFQREIDAQLAITHQEMKAASEERLNGDPRFRDLPALQEQREAQLALGRSSTTASAIADDPAVREAQARVDGAAATLAAAQQAVTCEAEGVCGSGHPGAGPAYASKIASRDAATTALTTAQQELTVVQQTARDSAATARTDAQRAAEQLGQRINELESGKRTASAKEAAAIDANTGLLARLSALHRLTSNDPVMFWAHGLLFLLLAALEVMPILVKLLLSFSKPSAYEKALNARAADLRSRAERAVAARERQFEQQEAHRAALEQADVDGLLAIARQRVSRQLQLAKQEARHLDKISATKEGLRLERERMRTLRALNKDRAAAGLPPIDVDTGVPVVAAVAPPAPSVPDPGFTPLLLPRQWDRRERLPEYDLGDVLRRPPGRS